MKKILLTLLLFISLSSLLLFASDDKFSFSLVGEETLYKEAIADPYSFTTHIYTLFYTNENDAPYYIRGLVKDENENVYYKDFQTKDLDEMKKRTGNVSMKVGAATSLARLKFDLDSFPEIKAELNLNGYLDSCFLIGGHGDCVGFNGSYFIGGTVCFDDFLTIRAGIHHFSGHYGDEVLSDFFSYNQVVTEGNKKYLQDNQYELLGLAEYVRDNSWLVSVQTNVLKDFTISASLEIPQTKSWLRPFVHCPSKHETAATNGEDGFMDLASDEGFTGAEAETEKSLRDSSYKALRAAFSVDYRHEFKFGTAFFGVDFQAHQDGKTKHQVGQYNKSNSWDFEITAGGGFEFKDKLFGQTCFSVEAFIHYGRPSIVQYYYKNNATIIYVGFRVE